MRLNMGQHDNCAVLYVELVQYIPSLVYVYVHMYCWKSRRPSREGIQLSFTAYFYSSISELIFLGLFSDLRISI